MKGPAHRSSRRIARDFLLGGVIGGVGAALVWYFYPGFWKEPPASALEVAMQQRQDLQARASIPPAVAPVARAPAAPGTCQFEPLIPAAGASDGHARIEHPFPAGPRAKAKVFLRAAKKAAASGRARDAELALIASCRFSEEASGKPNVPIARVLALLGDAYVAALAEPHPPELQEQLRARAREVLERSAAIYAKALGPNAARSRQARQRVDLLEQEFATALPAEDLQPDWRNDDAVHSAPAPAAAAKAAPRPQPQARGARPERAPEAPAAPSARQPDGATQRALHADPELRQLEADLARLRAQAEAVSDDPAGLRRRAEAARAQRDRCADADCLRAWYGRRKRDLLAEF